MKVLVAIPTYNEAPTVATIVRRTVAALPEADLLIVDDGSRDGTPAVLKQLGVPVIRHLCNLGYPRAVQTAIKYAVRHGYTALATLDADGQHSPEQLREMVDEFRSGRWDLLLGSRFVATGKYQGVNWDRRIGMRIFSELVRLLTRRRVYDTTSGLKVMGREVLERLEHSHAVDFHAETIVYLTRLGYSIGEYPVEIGPRLHGTSMHSRQSYLRYPLKTLLMTTLGYVEAGIDRRRVERGSDR